jgi:hypothetical protein
MLQKREQAPKCGSNEVEKTNVVMETKIDIYIYAYIFARRSDCYDIVKVPFSKMPKNKYYQNKK